MFKKFCCAILLSSVLPLVSMEKRSFEWELLPAEIKQKIARNIIENTKPEESKKLYITLKTTNRLFSSPDFINSFTNTVMAKTIQESWTLRLQLSEKIASFQTLQHTNRILSHLFKSSNQNLDSMEIEQQESINTLQTKLDTINDILAFLKRIRKSTSKNEILD